jgi:hypothetical protein
MPESRGDSARPWRRPDVCSPSRWAQGVCGRRIAQANPCRTWGWYPGCEGEKPWHPSPEKRPRERPPREGKPTANEDATPRRKRVWGTGTVEETVTGEARHLALPSSGGEFEHRQMTDGWG